MGSAKENFVPEIKKISSFQNVDENSDQPMQGVGDWKAFAGEKYKYKVYVYSKNEYSSPSLQVSDTLNGGSIVQKVKKPTQGTDLADEVKDSEIIRGIIEGIVAKEGGKERRPLGPLVGI